VLGVEAVGVYVSLFVLAVETLPATELASLSLCVEGVQVDPCSLGDVDAHPIIFIFVNKICYETRIYQYFDEN